MAYMAQAIRAGRRFDPILAELDESTRRQLHLLVLDSTPAPDDPAHAAELARLGTEMESIYGKGKSCDAADNCRDLLALEEVMGHSRDSEELLAAWQGWHAIGRQP